MDFDVTDFNVRLRTIRLRELIIAIIIAIFLALVYAITVPYFDGFEEIMVIFALTVIFIFFIYALRGTHGLRDNFSKLLQKDNRNEVLYVFIINLLFAFIIVAFFSSIDVFYSFLDPGYAPILDSSIESVDPFIYFLEALSSIVFAPILEELIFRGVLFNRLKIRIGIIGAMLISSFIFAMGHEFGGILSAFVFGICMCLLYLKTDNILMTMSIHFLNNLVCVIMEMGGLDGYLFEMPMLPLTLLISIISGLLIIVYIYQNTKLLTA